MKQHDQKIKFLILMGFSIGILAILSLTVYHGVASSEQNKTLIQPQGTRGMTSNATNIVLVHGAWADGSSWSKIIPILENAGLRVIAVQLPLHSLADDVATVKCAIGHCGVNHLIKV